MNKQAYLIHLKQMLVSQYSEVHQNPNIPPVKNQRIEGYMEAGLIANLVDHGELKEVINDAHAQVFGVTFDSRTEPTLKAEKLWDIPTWVRQGIEIEP